MFVGFLCPLSANTFNIDFIELKIKNADTNSTVCVAGRDPNTAPMREFPPGFDLDILRQIKYNFPRSLLDCSCVNTTYVTPPEQRTRLGNRNTYDLF
jgi:hypothetical protein